MDENRKLTEEENREWDMVRTELAAKDTCIRMKIISDHMEGLGTDLLPYRYNLHPDIEAAYQALGKAFVEAIKAEAKVLISK